MAPNRGSRSSAARGPHAPLVVIDEEGYEVGVVLDYAQYLSLLGVIATKLERDNLPGYWQRALDGCLVVPSTPS
jgi:hypothetical protein